MTPIPRFFLESSIIFTNLSFTEFFLGLKCVLSSFDDGRQFFRISRSTLPYDPLVSRSMPRRSSSSQASSMASDILRDATRTRGLYQ